MANACVEHIRQWAKDHNLSYMCAATEPAAREAYYAGKPLTKKRVVLKKKKLIAQMNEMLPKYIVYKNERAESGMMGREDVNILNPPRSAENMIPIANVEIPEPVNEGKRIVVGKTISVKRRAPTPFDSFTKDELSNALKYVTNIRIMDQNPARYNETMNLMRGNKIMQDKLQNGKMIIRTLKNKFPTDTLEEIGSKILQYYKTRFSS